MAIENGHKLANQWRKALKLVQAIDRGLLTKGVDVFDQAGAIWLASRDWSESDWKRIADVAGVNPPSPDTIEIVRSVYRDRSRAMVRPFPRLAS